MQHILTASNSDVLKLLGSRACARLGFARHIVSSGIEAVNAARHLKPRLAVLDGDMPDVNGFEACRRIKAEPTLKETRVMLVLQGPFTRDKLGQVAEAGCDDVMVLPALDAEFFAHVADLLSLPRRHGRRVTVELLARVEEGTRTWEGFIENLSTTGAKVQLLEQLPSLPFVRAWMRRQRGGRVTEVDARVVWRQDDGRGVGLEFRNVSLEVREQIEALMLWDVALEDGQLRVYLDGDFIETTDFAGLDRQLAGSVDFDASGVRYINSHGSRLWVAFLRELDTVEHYTFSRCSVAFTLQAAMLDGFLGKGRIVSMMVPYHCETCDREDIRLLQVAAITDETGALALPSFRCSRCGSRLNEEEIPEKYFGFVKR
ncbi:MAG: PilZ domain-containing protein [Thermoanaerobaculaceae bacterium]|nr:PilZ domain-containing protein [Thermoanaerobaculaceae bacterium]